MRKALLQQLIERFRNPDQMITETCAITCRVAPSFLRVGHVELHGRRAGSGERTLPEGPAREAARQQLRALVEHALFREYPECREEGKVWWPWTARAGKTAKTSTLHLAAVTVRDHSSNAAIYFGTPIR